MTVSKSTILSSVGPSSELLNLRQFWGFPNPGVMNSVYLTGGTGTKRLCTHSS